MSEIIREALPQNESEELTMNNARIAELEAKLAALTTRQPMETVPMDGTWVFVVLDCDVPRRLRWTGKYWESIHEMVSESLCLGWYALPEEVSRG